MQPWWTWDFFKKQVNIIKPKPNFWTVVYVSAMKIDLYTIIIKSELVFINVANENQNNED